MTPENARAVTAKIREIWPFSKILDSIWLEVLETLDVARTRDAIRYLRDNDPHAPSVARFRQAYREQGTAQQANERTPCVICDGAGWETITSNRPGWPYATSGVVPCRCANGQQYRDGHRRAVAANDLQRRLTGDPDNAQTAQAAGF